MTIKCKIRKGDRVIVLAGRDKGRKGEVLKVMPRQNRALVQGINMVSRHQRQTAAQEAGIIRREAPVHISNLAIADPRDDTATRIGYTQLKDGRKVRVARKSGETIDG